MIKKVRRDVDCYYEKQLYIFNVFFILVLRTLRKVIIFRVYFSWKVGVIVYHPPTLSPIINLSWNFTIKGNQISLVVSVILRFTNRDPVTFLLWLDFIFLINICQLSTTIWFSENISLSWGCEFLMLSILIFNFLVITIKFSSEATLKLI